MPQQDAGLFPELEPGHAMEARLEAPGFSGSARLYNVGFTDASRSQVLTFRWRKPEVQWINAAAESGDYLVVTPDMEGDFTIRLRVVKALRRAVPTANARTAFISVRADWTDNRSMLGYYNPLTGVYVPTELLRLVLHAFDHPDEPHFVILDEMNLAKVEYYFSDFLSAMESGSEMVLHDAGDGVTAEIKGGELPIPERLRVPANLFFTGTVNVDETTYMFSPKVLDRSNVIEFHDVDLRAYAGQAAAERAASGWRRSRPGRAAEAPRRAQRVGRSGRLRDPQRVGKERLLAIHDRLALHHLHFGYRVANEVARYMNLAREHLGPDAEADALDLQLLQKVLAQAGRQRGAARAAAARALRRRRRGRVPGAARPRLRPAAHRREDRPHARDPPRGRLRELRGVGDGASAARCDRPGPRPDEPPRRRAGRGRQLPAALLARVPPALQRGPVPPGKRRKLLPAERRERVDRRGQLRRLHRHPGAARKDLHGHLEEAGRGRLLAAARRRRASRGGPPLHERRAGAAPLRAGQPERAPGALPRLRVPALGPAGGAPHAMQESVETIGHDPHRALVREERTSALWDARAVSPPVWSGQWRVAASGSRCQRVARSRGLRWPRRSPPSRGARRCRSASSSRSRAPRGTRPRTASCATRWTWPSRSSGGWRRCSPRAASATSGSTSACSPTRARCAADFAACQARASSPTSARCGTSPRSSQVLQRRQGYRDVLRHYCGLVAASRLSVLGADMGRLLETKTASTLYEYWCFFTLADELEQLLGAPLRADKSIVADDWQTSVREGITIDFPGGVRLAYNQSYGGNMRGSYSVPLRPDITLTVGEELHLLDAKFRLQSLPEATVDSGAADDEAQAVTLAQWTTFQRSDIHKMHAYKDALGARRDRDRQKVRSVWVLYPGDDTAFFSETRGRTKDVPDRREDLVGVGALPLQPDREPSELRRALRAMLQKALVERPDRARDAGAVRVWAMGRPRRDRHVGVVSASSPQSRPTSCTA